MIMKRNILHEPEHKKYDTGTIIKYNNETCLLMDNLIHTLDQDILEDTKESKELNAKNEKEQSKNDKLITDDLTHPRP